MSETDSIPKTMLILKSQATALGTVEIFLRNRGWKLYSTANLKEALIQIVTQKPSYILISVDHANKKVRALPRLLASAFPVATMVFAETQSAASFKILNESATEYRVYPPVTGPAIERCVNKYLKDQQTKMSVQQSEGFKADKGAPTGNDTISVKGGANSLLSIKGEKSEFGGESVNLLLSQFLGEELAIPAASTTEKPDSSMIFAQTWAEGNSPLQQSGVNGLEKSALQKGVAGQVESYIPSEEKSHHSQVSTQWVPMSDHEYACRLEKGRALSDVNETLIARGVQKSLEESVIVGAIEDKIQATTSAACIVIDSKRFSGYLIAAMGKNRQIDQAFMDTVRDRLFKFLKENGEELTKKDSMEVKIKQVDFEPWALVYAEFLRKSVHQGNEVAMAFFPQRQIKTIIEDSVHRDMAKIHLNEFHGDHQVEFDIYIYLPTNDKYVLYTPKGGVFYNKQMERLKKQGVTHMHIQKDAEAAVTKYKAQNYLNDMIEHHDQKQAEMVKNKVAS